MPAGEITLALAYRPPYLWERVVKFFAGRAIAGVETVNAAGYFRTVLLFDAVGGRVAGWVRVAHKPEENALAVGLSESLLPALPLIAERIRHQFDLYCEPHGIYAALSAMNEIRPGLCLLGTRLPGCFDAFEMAVRAVLGQQITVKAAGTLAARIVAAYGRPITTPIKELTHTFPTPEDLAAMGDAIQENFGKLGVTSARSRTILALAKALLQSEIDLEIGNRPEVEMPKLLAIRGIGSWTAQYIAMRALKWPDAFLDTDAGVKKALHPRTSREMRQMAEAWRPWRSYATVNLWHTLGAAQK